MVSEHRTLYDPNHSCRPREEEGAPAGRVKQCEQCGALWQTISEFGFYHRMDLIDRLTFRYRQWRNTRRWEYQPHGYAGSEER